MGLGAVSGLGVSQDVAASCKMHARRSGREPQGILLFVGTCHTPSCHDHPQTMPQGFSEDKCEEVTA